MSSRRKFDRIYRTTNRGVTIDISVMEGEVPYVYFNMYEGKKKISRGMSIIEAIRLATAILEGVSKYPLIVGSGRKPKKPGKGWYRTKKGWWRFKVPEEKEQEETKEESGIYDLDEVLDEGGGE